MHSLMLPLIYHLYHYQAVNPEGLRIRKHMSNSVSPKGTLFKMAEIGFRKEVKCNYVNFMYHGPGTLSKHALSWNLTSQNNNSVSWEIMTDKEKDGEVWKTSLVLTNILYFLGTWKTIFPGFPGLCDQF